MRFLNLDPDPHNDNGPGARDPISTNTDDTLDDRAKRLGARENTEREKSKPDATTDRSGGGPGAPPTMQLDPLPDHDRGRRGQRNAASPTTSIGATPPAPTPPPD